VRASPPLELRGYVHVRGPVQACGHDPRAHKRRAFRRKAQTAQVGNVARFCPFGEVLSDGFCHHVKAELGSLRNRHGGGRRLQSSRWLLVAKP